MSLIDKKPLKYDFEISLKTVECLTSISEANCSCHDSISFSLKLDSYCNQYNFSLFTHYFSLLNDLS